MYGKCHSEEAKARMSAAHTGKVLSRSHRDNISSANKRLGRKPPNIKGRKLYNNGVTQTWVTPDSFESYEKLGWTRGMLPDKVRSGYSQPPGAAEKAALTRKERHGGKLSEETKAKMRAAHKGRPKLK